MDNKQPYLIQWDQLPAKEVRDGIEQQRTDGEQSSIVRYRYAPGSTFPAHSHPEEQVTVVLSGTIMFEIGSQPIRVSAGEVLLIPGGTVHRAWVEGTEAVDSINVLAPRRSREITFIESN